MVLAILSISLSIFAQTLGASLRLDPVSIEKSVAAEAARSQFEEMRNHPFSQLFQLYNDDPSDDPGGPGTAPGSRFAVKDLTPVTPGQPVGRVIFPTVGNQLRENISDENFGMPRDLNGDDVVDNANHATDCIILPVQLRLEWVPTNGKDGRRNFVMYTMFSAL